MRDTESVVETVCSVLFFYHLHSFLLFSRLSLHFILHELSLFSYMNTHVVDKKNPFLLQAVDLAGPSASGPSCRNRATGRSMHDRTVPYGALRPWSGRSTLFRLALCRDSRLSNDKAHTVAHIDDRRVIRKKREKIVGMSYSFPPSMTGKPLFILVFFPPPF